jgi:hypothetical protein
MKKVVKHFTKMTIFSFTHAEATEYFNKWSKGDVQVVEDITNLEFVKSNELVLRDNDQILDLTNVNYNFSGEVTDFVKFKLVTDLENSDHMPKNYLIAYKHDVMLLKTKKELQIRYFEIDGKERGKINSTGLLKKKISEWGIRNYRTLALINNNDFIVIAESIPKTKKAKNGVIRP